MNDRMSFFRGFENDEDIVLPGFENDEDIVHPKKNEVTRWNITECR